MSLDVNGAVDAVLFDFGGVLAGSPFDAFDRYEQSAQLPAGFIRSLNATNPHDNAWARLERNELTFDEFCLAFEAEAAGAGGRIDTRALFSSFSGELRPEMIEAVRRCRTRFKTGLLTNNFVTPLVEGERAGQLSEVLALFDAVVESSVVGIRKPDPKFYELACRMLGVEPHRSVFLDDLGVNLKPARALGMVTIKVTESDAALGELEAVLGLPLR
ncbi:MAG TPA: HAD-IA family hydrolase [Acidimicrobiales bacterium]|nr:HAD-IA family hydrolase [Acidimicrobiales bacterium]